MLAIPFFVEHVASFANITDSTLLCDQIGTGIVEIRLKRKGVVALVLILGQDVVLFTEITGLGIGVDKALADETLYLSTYTIVSDVIARGT